jgi:serine/threonine-protein kinase
VALIRDLSDRYRLERELGQGGMATVYLARDLKHDRNVALKVLKPELGAALGAERFLAEIRTTANLRHPHILPLYDSGAAAEVLYYVMPFVEGETLRDRLEREKQLPLDDALQIAREVADALSYAHSRGVIHRDIKPENILLESGHAVVADFGIARAVSAAGGDRLTETGLSVGTPTYMSPEQATGSAELDGRSDLYALACVLYEMLAGQPPFSGPTAESLVRQHIMVEAPPVTNLRPAVPAGIAAALQRALAKTPADRFNPVAQFAETLRSDTATRAVPTGPGPGSAPRRSLLSACICW